MGSLEQSLVLALFSTLVWICNCAPNTTGPVEEAASKVNVSSRLTDLGPFRNQRIVNQPHSSATANVNPQTSLYVQPGQAVSLYFDVTNNNNWNSYFYFYCNTQTSIVQSIQPTERWIAGLDTVTVAVKLVVTNSVAVGNSGTATETITFVAATPSTSGDDATYVKAFLYAGQQPSDSSSPDLSYSITGDCRNANTPSTCSSTSWSLQANIQDRQSGLLSVTTVPAGFMFTSDFTSGTKDQVSGRYGASCCLNLVDLIATDLNGNQYKTSIDINYVWLSAGTITAIVLGCILLLVLLILICCAIILCIRRRRKTSTFTMHS